MKLYFAGTITNNKLAYAYIEREIHLVDNLAINILLGVDILAPEKARIDFATRCITFSYYDEISVPIDIAPRGQSFKQSVKSMSTIVVPAG